jgi:Domain of unknown function (DUF4190)
VTPPERPGDPEAGTEDPAGSSPRARPSGAPAEAGSDVPPGAGAPSEADAASGSPYGGGVGGGGPYGSAQAGGYPYGYPYEAGGYPYGAGGSSYAGGQSYGGGGYPYGGPWAGHPGYGGVPPQGGRPAGLPAPGWPPARPTNGMAVASLVLGALWIYWVGSVLALIFGYQARRQIAARGEGGDGLAVAGIVLGWVGVGVLALVLGVIGVAAGLS